MPGLQCFRFHAGSPHEAGFVPPHGWRHWLRTQNFSSTPGTQDGRDSQREKHPRSSHFQFVSSA